MVRSVYSNSVSLIVKTYHQEIHLWSEGLLRNLLLHQIPQQTQSQQSRNQAPASTNADQPPNSPTAAPTDPGVLSWLVFDAPLNGPWANPLGSVCLLIQS
jgi:hypothetical protein